MRSPPRSRSAERSGKRDVAPFSLSSSGHLVPRDPGICLSFTRHCQYNRCMKATNLVIGTLTLAVIGAGFVGMLAFQKIRAVRNQSPLRIVFNGSASGLRKGGTVIFDGVPA